MSCSLVNVLVCVLLHATCWPNNSQVSNWHVLIVSMEEVHIVQLAQSVPLYMC